MAHSDDTEEKKTVNVVDRRRFDSSGTERTESAQAQPEEKPAVGAEAGFKIEAGPDKEEVAFGSFIMSLATQVLVQMGEMPAPNGMEIPVDLTAARQTIDIIAMLQRRTRGNLSAEEAHFLEEVLHSLRSSFVLKSKKA
jgi:Domain of unknown function (DUF1844)